MEKKAKRGDVKLTHNLYDVLGNTLLSGVQSGRLDPNKLQNLTANLGIDLGKGYGMDLGYNQYMGDRKQDLKIKITKKF
tara:strand:- start:70 stop:306 length:237 start_codon:yes stop_codon:yes gene_type:complete